MLTDLLESSKAFGLCPMGSKIIHSLKLVDYLHVQADNPWYNFYIFGFIRWDIVRIPIIWRLLPGF